MGKRSKLSQAKAEIQAEFARLVGEGVTYDAILTALRGLGADLSRSGVGREAAKLKKAIARKEEARALAEQFTRNVRDSAGSDIVRGAVESLGSMMLMYLDAKDDPQALDPKDFQAIGRALESLGKAKNMDITAALNVEKAEAKAASEAAALATDGAPGSMAGRLEIVFVESANAGVKNPLEALAPKVEAENTDKGQ